MVSVRNTLTVSIFVVALAGCGGGGDSSSPATGGDAATVPGDSTSASSTAATQAVPEAAQPVTELIPVLDRLGAQGKCADAVELLNQVDLPDPEGGANAENCRAIQGFLDLTDSYVAKASAEFGTGALIDGTAPGEQFATLTAVLDQTKRFTLVGTATKGPQVGTAPSPDTDFEAPANRFVKALRDDDCKSARAAVSPISRLAYESVKQFCSVFEANFMTAPGLGARLQADPAAELVDMGGTRNVHFFGLPTEPAGYRTIVVGTVAGGVPLISDIVPVER